MHDCTDGSKTQIRHFFREQDNLKYCVFIIVTEETEIIGQPNRTLDGIPDAIIQVYSKI